MRREERYWQRLRLETYIYLSEGKFRKGIIVPRVFGVGDPTDVREPEAKCDRGALKAGANGRGDCHFVKLPDNYQRTRILQDT